MPIAVDIDVMLARRKMSVGELADRIGITPANLAVLKNGRAKAVRFATLAALCETLECQPGDLLRWEAEDVADETGVSGCRRDNARRRRPVHAAVDTVSDLVHHEPLRRARIKVMPQAASEPCFGRNAWICLAPSVTPRAACVRIR